jgi:hypothetical protein
MTKQIRFFIVLIGVMSFAKGQYYPKRELLEIVDWCFDFNGQFSVPYIKVCDANDPSPELNHCLKQTFQHLTKFLSTGLKELNLPPFDPLKVPEFDIINNAGEFNFNMKLRNFVVRGGTGLVVNEVKSNIPVIIENFSLKVLMKFTGYIFRNTDLI